MQPILADRCFHCHGPDAKNQQSEFRMDGQENLFADLGGYAAIVPGNLKESELHARIHSVNNHDVMPPPDSNRELSAEEKRILDLWIEQGAAYQQHWAFKLPQRASIPADAIRQAGWSDDTKEVWLRNPIDAFVGRRLRKEKLVPSSPAEPEVQLRRAALTLTGMLPPETLQERFLANPTEEAYHRAVDELLASTNYAERQTLRWLDAARYADTDGYQIDTERTNWPWRDWVIQVMHANMPFDQFTIEQLAGDMLPEATDSQRLATAFNRNHRQNAEAGALAEEFGVENVIDRVETTSTVWLGLTMGCCRCHDHKYDPISQREFYQFYGYFNNIGESGIGRGVNANPVLKTTSPLAKVDATVIAAREKAKKQLQEAEAGLPIRRAAWLSAYRPPNDEVAATWTLAEIESVNLSGDGRLTVNRDQTVQYSPGEKGTSISQEFVLNAASDSITAIKLTALVDPSFAGPRRLAPSVNGNFVLTDLSLMYDGRPVPLDSASATFEQSGFPVANIIDQDLNSGWAVFGSGVKAEPVSAIVGLAYPATIENGTPLVLHLRYGSQYANHVIGKLRIELSDDPEAGRQSLQNKHAVALSALTKPADQRTSPENEAIAAYYQTLDQPLRRAEEAFAKADAVYRDQAGKEVRVMVMREKQGDPTPIYLLDRGQYDEPVKDDPLTRGLPEQLFSSDDSHQPANRLELAQWIVTRRNPLTARVIVNRLWQDHFGQGLVKTVDDFGLQGDMPSHPELLDWLAIEFIDSGWDLQAMHRLIVTSATYRQSSVHTATLNERDPENRLLARGPRFRADGFTIRDIALQASGLLNETIGGSSVKPYQPKGLWETVAGSAGTRYEEGMGDELYRKSMYTYWKRAVNPPRQTIFDAGGREVCSVRTSRTNTPLQALVLMNDKTFIECARNLAQRVMKSNATTDHARIGEMFRLSTARAVDEETQTILMENLSFFRQHFSQLPTEVASLLEVGASPRDSSVDPTELAAMTAVAHLIMNLDAFVTIE
ncbi:PSD1 and planctomycete cytochrome C domain-containing protein [Blastopirellula marina]|uniref:PSD1 and planctomycete cytochrome C domain-containing protein n=1 Tax=Blastopirellula marina TaxID=124 RepID=UPI001E4DD4A3|nr:PSD1 and planctomycete cytochrome C domain-containing protein [Blastopirellula marina]